MNKKKFKKSIASMKKQKNSSISPFFINELFKKEKRSLFNNEKIETLIADNFPDIMSCVSRGNITQVLDTLYEHDAMKSFMESERTIKYILDNVKHDDFYYILVESSMREHVKKFIHNNFDYILENYPMKKIVHLYEQVELSDLERKKMDVYFEDKKEAFLSEILAKTLSLKGNVDNNKMGPLLKYVVKIVDSALEKEHCKITDIKILLGGGYSNVIRIGDTIVKLGIPRKTFDIPNDKRILQPYLRKDLTDQFGVEASIEVCDRADTDISLSEDELYAIYKDMRDRGIVCGDFKYDNVGRLIKPNTPRNSVSNGMIGEVKETLGPGDYVIIDSDFIYSEGDPKTDLSSDLSRKFNSRYMEEQKAEQSKKVNR